MHVQMRKTNKPKQQRVLAIYLWFIPAKPFQPCLVVARRAYGALLLAFNENVRPGANPKKLFTAVIYMFRKKIECLNLAGFSRLV